MIGAMANSFGLGRRFLGRVLTWLTSPWAIRTVGETFFWMVGRRWGRQGPIRRILIVDLRAIGDGILAGPFVRELRRNFSRAWITWVVDSRVFPLVELCPYVDEVVPYDTHLTRKLLSWQRTWRVRGRVLGELVSLARQHLWKRRFDFALLPFWDVDYHYGAHLVYLSGASRRCGYSSQVIDRKQDVNRDNDLLFTHLVNDSSIRHDVEHNLALLRSLGLEVREDSLELWLDDRDRRFAERVLGLTGDSPILGFGPGARDLKRRWPIDSFLQLGTWLVKEFGARLVVVGEPGEKEMGEALKRGIGDSVIDVVGSTTLRQAAALLERCALFIGNDTGSMHLAAAGGARVVEISCHPRTGSPSSFNSPLRFGPWGTGHHILQPMVPRDPCREFCSASQPHCITAISVDQVKRAIEKELSLLSSRGAPRPHS